MAARLHLFQNELFPTRAASQSPMAKKKKRKEIGNMATQNGFMAFQ